MQTLRSIVLTGICLWTVCAHAGAPELVHRAMDKLKTWGQGDRNCWLCISARNPEEPSAREKCIAQLCPTRPISDEEVTAEARKQADSDPEYKKAEKLILDTLVQQVRQKRQDDQFLLDSLHRNLEFKSPRARAYVRLMKSASSPSQYVRLDENGNLDVEAVKKAMFEDHRSTADADLLIQFYRSYLKMLEDPKAAFSDYDALKSTLSESELKKRLLDGQKEVERTAEQLSQVSGLPREAFYSSANVKEDRRQIEAGTISEARFDDIKNNMISHRLRLQIYTQPEKWGKETGAKLLLRDLLPPKIEERLAMQIAVADKILNSDFSKDERPYYRALDRTYRKCTFALEEGYAMSPSAAQLSRFKDTERLYRKEFGEKIDRFLSTKSAAAIAKSIGTWKIKMPPQRDQFLAAFSERIASEGESRGVGELAKNSISEARELAIAELAGNDDLKDDDEYFDSMNTVCTSEVPQAFGDLAQFKKESITVSSRTVVRPDYAKQILFHEYSHLLSTAIRNNGVISSETKHWYDSFRKCLGEQRGSKKAFIEEDFAQSLAAALASETAHFNCEKQIPWTKDELFTLQDSPTDKDHSGTMYNLVLGLFARGGDFSDCRTALSEAGEKEIPQSCFEKVQPAATAK